jgi:hypothetical protein
MWRELCVRSAAKEAVGDRIEAHDWKDALKSLTPLVPTNRELSTPEYLFSLPTEALHRGLTAPGGPRLARLVAKLDAGLPIKVVAMGGSVSANGRGMRCLGRRQEFSKSDPLEHDNNTSMNRCA